MKKKPTKNTQPTANYGTPGMLYGMGVGTVFGACFVTFTAVWVLPIFAALGMMIGLAVGSSLKKPTPPTDDTTPDEK